MAPDGAEFGGRPWQSIGTITVAEDGTELQVQLRQSGEGILAADAIRFRLLDPVLPGLEILDLSGNPLDNRAHEIFVPQLAAAGVDVRFEANDAPVIDQLPNQGGTPTALDFDGIDDVVLIGDTP